MDLITMPTHGCGTFRDALLGSVAEKVIHNTHCPSSIPVIRKAGEVATAFESSLVLAHAIGSSEKRTESEVRSQLEQLEWSGEVSVPTCIVLIRDTWNTEIVDGLKPKPGDIILYKTRFSGFYQTGLDNILKTLNARYLVVTGCTTSVCVESTARDAMFRDYSCLLLEDCMAEPVGNVSKNSTRSRYLAGPTWKAAAQFCLFDAYGVPPTVLAGREAGRF